MKSIFWKTLGGLSAECYLRHLFFGLMFPLLLYFALRDNPHPQPFALYLFVIVNTLLYPYARFVYEGVVSFILGRNFYIINIWVMLMLKFITMFACWLFAMLVAPLGLLYLYFRNSQRAEQDGSFSN